MNSIAPRRRTARAFAAVASAALLSTTMLACSSGGGTGGEKQSDEGGASGDQVTITYLSWANEEMAAPFIKAFEDAHPDIKVEFSYSPPVAEYVQTVQTRFAGGQAPNIFRIAPENRATLIAEGLVQDLSDIPGIDVLGAANRAEYEVDGALYGASVGAWEAGIIYNPELLAQAGAESVPATWDEFLELCSSLKELGITPYLEPVDDVPKIFQSFLGAQFALHGPEGGERAIFEGDATFAELWPEALEQYNRLFTEGVLGAEAVGLNGDQVRDGFVNGNVAMVMAGPWDIAALDEAGIDYEFALTPAAPGGEQFGAGAPDPGFAISSSTEGAQLEASRTFIEWLVSPEGLSALHDATGDITTTSNFQVAVAPQYETIYKDGLLESKFYLSMTHWLVGADALQVEATALIQQMAQGQLTPLQVAEGMDAKLATIID